MAIIGINIEAKDEFRFPDDKNDPTTWLLGTLSSRVLGILMDQSAVFAANTADTDSMKAEFKGSQAAYNVVQFGLRGWSNFVTDGGEQIVFATAQKVVPGAPMIKLDAVPDALMELIPLDRIRELSEQIQKRNEVTKDEGKTSAS